LFAPSAVSPTIGVIEEMIWGLTTWILTLGLLELYVEREAQVRARAALKGRGARQS
jgi:hypothetical protein